MPCTENGENKVEILRMSSNENGENKVEYREESGACISTNGCENKDRVPANPDLSLDCNLVDKKKNKYLEMITSLPIRSGFMKLTSSPSLKLRKFADERDGFSRSVVTPEAQESPRNFLVRKINWTALSQMAKEWIKNPMNMALFIWITCVAVSGAILFMVMTGMLNRVLPRKSQRDTWFEVNNQILNALFTLMCLYQHPRRFHHLALLLRWREDDILRLRKIYCKNGSYKPHEWFHMMVVVILLHVNCFAQYALCGLNIGYRRSQRPPIGVALCISVAIAAPVVATVYNILSPLGREYDYELDEEAQSAITSPDDTKRIAGRAKSLEKKFSFVAREDQRVAESTPEWIGGLFDVWDSISLAYLSIFCSFCVFGWNMDRLGFGNMYVHIATFLLLCVAPFWIFNLAAINIDNEVVREVLGVSGILLCVFGLLYGGFWRIQMRKKFNLPGNKFCCGNPSLTDCFQWLCCCSCSLAQEVRTADFYDIKEDKFYLKQSADGTVGSPIMMSPLHREAGSPLIRSNPGSPLWGNSGPSLFMSVNSSPSRLVKIHEADSRLPVVMEDESSKGSPSMIPPVPPTLHRENNQTT